MNKVILAVLTLSLCCAAIPVSAAITVDIDDQRVTATGLTPGAGAVIFSVGHQPHFAYYSLRRVVEFVSDEDRDGVISYATKAAVPVKSVWVIVDAATGRHSIASPAGSRNRVTGERLSWIGRDADGQSTRLLHDRSWLELLVVRPGRGAWELTAMRGGYADVERRPDEFLTPLHLFRPVLPGGAKLERLVAGDIVIAIDPNAVEYFLLKAE